MSSPAVIKSVSKKLKYYFEVKRLEDGFDLTGPDCPRLDHPPMKARPTLMYDGLHDRPLKHYFSPYDVRVRLTQLKPHSGKHRAKTKPMPEMEPETDEGKQKKVKKKLERYMNSYTYMDPVLADAYYLPARPGGKKQLRPEASGGFGVGMKKRKGTQGGYPVLRNRPPQYISRVESQRLLNAASKMLLATEMIDLKSGKKTSSVKSRGSDRDDSSSYVSSHVSSYVSSRESQSSSRSKEQSAPHPFESDRKLPEVDNGNVQRQKSSKRKQRSRRCRRQVSNSEVEGDAAYSTPIVGAGPPYMTIEGEEADDETVPPWLKEEMRKADAADDSDSQTRCVKPHFTPRPSERASCRTDRPLAAKYRHKPRPDELPPNAAQADWNTGSSTDEGEVQSDAVVTQMVAKSQAENHPMEREITEGEKVMYKVHVFTGGCLGAGTKAEVHLKLYGDKGYTPDVFLRESKISKVLFQKGQEDVFEFEQYYVGALHKIKIGHNKKGMGYGWFLDRVLVKDTEHRISYNILCDSWLSSSDGDDSTARLFNVQSSSTYLEDRDRESSQPPSYVAESQPQPPETQYVSVVSSSKSDNEESSALTSSRTSLQSVDGQSRRQEAVAADQSSGEDSTVSSSSYTESGTETESEREIDEIEATPSAALLQSPKVRRDDFFDQKVKDKDYSSVIESLAEQESKDDLESDRPQYSERRQPKMGTLTLVTHPEAGIDSLSMGSDTVVLMTKDTGRTEQKGEATDGVKSGMEGARQSDAHHSEMDNAESRLADAVEGSSIHAAAEIGDLIRVKELAYKNPLLKTSKNEKGWSVLHVAAACGHEEVLQWLSISVLDLDVETRTGYTPMHLAAMHGHTDCMKVLEAMGATIGVKSLEGQTPLHVAAMNGQLDSARWLVSKRCDVGARDNAGRTPCQLALQCHNSQVEQFLRLCEQEASESGISPHMADSLADESSAKNAKRTTTDIWRRKDAPSDNDTSSSSSNNSSRSSSDETEDELVRSVKKKHDPELMEKRRLYQEQQEKMKKTKSSFLHSVRTDVDEEMFNF